MRAWSSSRFGIPLPAGHRFPIVKYALVREAVVASGALAPQAIHEPDPADRAVLTLAHAETYVDAVLGGKLTPEETRRLGFPWSEDLRERALRTAQGTLEASGDALAEGAGINLAGGTHHAFSDRGEGFCVFNDAAVAIRALQQERRIRRAVIIDLDVHQGNGTARIFADDRSVFTFSMHGERNYPFRKEESRLDIGFPDGCGDTEYLGALERHLDPVLDQADADLAVFLAGADPYGDDRFGRLRLSIDGLARRDRMVFSACRRRGLPVVMVLAGGYARRVEDIVTIHLNTVRELQRAFG